MTVAGSAVEVRRMRVRSRDRDTLATRLRLERLVTRADLHPAGIERRAILCVRRLRPAPAQGLSPEAFRGWEHHVSELLGRIARRAGRPALGPSTGDAEAVLFRDRAEMLACLASDWARGLAATRWWWRVLLAEAPQVHRVVQAFVEAPEFVPPAMERLARAGGLPGFVRRLEASHTRAIRRAVALKFAVTQTLEVWEEAAARVTDVVAEARQRAPEEAAWAAPVTATARAAPWRPHVPEVAAMQFDDWERECLAALAMMVARVPVVAASPVFREAIREWSVAVERAAERLAHGRASTAHDVSISPAAASVPLAQESPIEWSIETPSRGATVHAAHEPPRKPEEAPVREDPPIDRSLPPETPTAGPEAPAPVPESPSAAPLPTRAADEFVRFEAPPPERTVETEFGGLFYLVNVGLALGYYADFTRPADPGIDLPLWDYVAIVGRSLAGEIVEDDPIWPLLADLAGRDRDAEPGEEFDAGWIGDIVRRTRARLEQALGDALALLCPLHARVVLTETHLDAHFRLDDLPIEVRVAGLDRDPGWVPAARRDLRFHFL